MLVLTYHSISDGPPPLCVSRDRLAEQLDFLLGLGLEAVPAGSIAGMLAAGNPGHTTFAITFDDGYHDFIENALPVLEARKLPATLFALPPVDDVARSREGKIPYTVPGGTRDRVLRPDELRDVIARGIEIGAHSVSHCDLTKLSDSDVERELRESREILARLTHTPITTFAYPFGGFDARLRNAAQRHFEAAFTTQLAAVPQGGDPLAIPRLDAFYLDSPVLRRAIASGRPERYLTPRRWLRRLRGTEPRQALVIA